MAESYIPVQKATTPSKNVATYEFTNVNSVVVESEAVTLTDSSGDELLGAKPSAESIPVVFATDSMPLEVIVEPTTATLNNGAETAVTGAAAQYLAANPNRVAAIIQNTGSSNIRIGVTGVTATTGLRVIPNQTVTLEMPYCSVQALFAISEGTDSTVFAQEITVP